MFVSPLPSSSKWRSLRFVPPAFREGGDLDRDLLVERELLVDLDMTDSVGDTSVDCDLRCTARVLDCVLIGGGLTAGGRIDCVLAGAGRGIPAIAVVCYSGLFCSQV